MIDYILVLLLIVLVTTSSILISASLIEIPKTSEEEYMNNTLDDTMVAQYMHHKSKCFDCEADMIDRHGEDGAWMANPSKTFSAEADGIAQAGGDLSGGFLAKTMKYY